MTAPSLPNDRTPRTGEPAWLHVRDLACELGGAAVVDGVGLDLKRGELGALLGPSGSGKTTLLRAIAGLCPVARGSVSLRGVEVSAPGKLLAPEHRRIGVVFQDLALFPHLDVTGNVAFGLTTLDRSERTARVAELLGRFELSGLSGRRPHELSGGQQQRVAIARALAPQPDLLLLDEPFSSLDADLRARLRVDIHAVLREIGVTALLVTHDHAEALAFADRIGVLVDGRMRQWADPRTVYHQPSDATVAAFVGEGCLIDATTDVSGRLATAIGVLDPESPSPGRGQRRRVLVRPHQIEATGPDSGVPARVLHAEFAGADTRLTVETACGVRLSLRWVENRPPRLDELVRIAARPGTYPHYPVDSGQSP